MGWRIPEEADMEVLTTGARHIRLAGVTRTRLERGLRHGTVVVELAHHGRGGGTENGVDLCILRRCLDRAVVVDRLKVSENGEALSSVVPEA